MQSQRQNKTQNEDWNGSLVFSIEHGIPQEALWKSLGELPVSSSCSYVSISEICVTCHLKFQIG